MHSARKECIIICDTSATIGSVTSAALLASLPNSRLSTDSCVRRARHASSFLERLRARASEVQVLLGGEAPSNITTFFNPASSNRIISTSASNTNPLTSLLSNSGSAAWYFACRSMHAGMSVVDDGAHAIVEVETLGNHMLEASQMFCYPPWLCFLRE